MEFSMHVVLFLELTI